MTNFGILNYFLGLEKFLYTSRGIFLHQKKYIQDVLKKFKKENCNEIVTPMEANVKLIEDKIKKSVNGNLYNLPNINFGVGLVSQFMSDPRVSHMVVVKHIQRYLKGTQSFGLLFSKWEGICCCFTSSLSNPMIRFTTL
ncbi:hypothetical protein CR513_33946, partial [Mucuna pruriens]